MGLRVGERFPALTVQVVGGPRLTVPRDVAGANKVVLFYRGGW